MGAGEGASAEAMRLAEDLGACISSPGLGTAQRRATCGGDGGGLIAGAAGLAMALFLWAIVANTPVRVSSFTLCWSTVVMGSFAVVVGMAVEAVRQLQQSTPDPQFHREHQARRRREG